MFCYSSIEIHLLSCPIINQITGTMKLFGVFQSDDLQNENVPSHSQQSRYSEQQPKHELSDTSDHELMILSIRDILLKASIHLQVKNSKAGYHSISALALPLAPRNNQLQLPTPPRRKPPPKPLQLLHNIHRPR
jgi:hypothetical protein